MINEQLTSKHDRLLAEFYHSKSRSTCTAAAAATHQRGQSSQNVILILHDKYLSVHYNGHRWENGLGEREAKLIEIIALVNIREIKSSEQKDNTSFRLVPGTLHRSWQGEFSLTPQDGPEFMAALTEAHRQRLAERRQQEIEDLELQLASKKTQQA